MASVTSSRPRPARRLSGLSYEWQALVVVVIGTFMVILDTTVVNIALPKIITVFNAPVDTAQFVLTAYLIALAMIMPASGYLSDTLGTKRIYLISLLLFTAGSLLCSLSWDVMSLVFFRVLQGLGGGMLTPLGMTIIYQTTPPERRGLVTGVFGLPILFAPVVGPTLGGYVVEYIDWRFIFTLNLPIGALGMLLAWVLLRETPLRPGRHFDLAGFILSGLGFASVFYGLDRGPDYGWGDLRVIALVGGGTAVLFLWILVELNQPQPLLNLRVLRNGVFALATGVNFVVTVAMYGSLLLLPLFLQNYRGLGALESGLLLFPQALAAGLMMPISGRLFDRVGPRPLIVPGLVLLAYATWQLSFLNLSTSDATLRWILVLRGLAMGLVFMPAMTTAMNTLSGPEIAGGSSLTNVLRQLFGAVGTALFVTVLQTRGTYHQAMLSQTITPDLPAVRLALGEASQILLHHGATLAQAKAAAIMAFYQGVATAAAVRAFQDCFYIAAAVCVLGVVPALFLRSSGLARRGGPAPME
jgi:EmrB/QacA subfamily drug resistance transporter